MAGRSKKAAEAVRRTYKPSPLLAQPGKRSRQEALPSALHMGLSVGLSLLAFAIISICVTMTLNPKNPFVKLVQSGVMMGMLTVTVLGTPNLGNSFTKAAQRIAGCMMGGWLFYGLYTASQAWWFLSVCLAVFAFMLVALSFFLTGREFLFPVALVTAFIVVCNFNSVKQAMVMTIVKTVAFSGATVLYTVISLLVFPLTATQQLLTTLASALKDLEQLADIVLVVGDKTAAPLAAQQGDSLSTSKNINTELDTAAGVAGVTQGKGISTANGTVVAAGKAGKRGKKGKKAPPPPLSVAAGLAATANHKLQLVQSLLRMTRKERYIGTIGSYRCFLPTVFLKRGVLPEEEVLAVVVNAGQVLRVLMTIMADFGCVPMAQRKPPGTLGPNAAKHLQPLAQQAVVALQDICAGLPVSGSSSYPVPVAGLQEYAEVLQQLVSDTVAVSTADTQSAASMLADTAVASDADAGPHGAAPASAAAGKWQKAAVAAVGITLPAERHQQLAAAFTALLSQTVTSEEGQVARWCNVLILSRQLGRSLAGLNDSVNEMLAKLPWLNAGAVM